MCNEHVRPLKYSRQQLKRVFKLYSTEMTNGQARELEGNLTPMMRLGLDVENLWNKAKAKLPRKFSFGTRGPR